MRTGFHFQDHKQAAVAVATDAPPIDVPSASGGQVDASCTSTITISCLQQLYNAVGYVPLANTGNQIAATGYLDQFANIDDFQLFFADQVPQAVDPSFTLVTVNGELLPCILLCLEILLSLWSGGENDQNNPGGEANLGNCLSSKITLCASS